MNYTKHILSKSTFVYGCQCPKRLYLHKFKPELRNPEDEAQQSIFSSGTNVGLLAQGLFPGGINAEPPDAFSYHLSVEKTQQLIKEGVNIIYEACFNYDGVLCAIDVLVKEDNKWYAFEVKGTTGVKSQHIVDAALQYFVIIKSGIKLEDIFIVHLNNQYVRRGEINVQELFTKQTIHEQVKAQQEFIETKIVELKKVISDRIEPIIEVGDQCDKPYPCDFSDYCWKNVEVEERNSDLEEYINKEYLKEFFSEFQYPLFYFDFETIMPAVPEFNNSRPYQQIPFQYSLHIQRNKNSELEHKEFLGDGTNDPRELLIKGLLSSLGNKGSIIVWNQTFEISRLKELARDFPKYEKQIYEVIERVVDLMVPFRKKQYYHPDFNESYSIKKVLPVLVPELNYSALEIQDGGSASLIYSELKNQNEGIQKEQRKNLLEYCKLDTLAMVKILEKINFR
jgi:Domain of unknown function(DUF2779)